MRSKVEPLTSPALVGTKLRLRDGAVVQLRRLVRDTRRPGWEAQVYEAADVRNPARRYAVKLYGNARIARVARDSSRRNARRAFQIGRLLDHPAIVRTHDLVDDAFLVMEWIDGRSLSQIMTAENYTSEMAWTWILALGEALASLTEALAERRPRCGHGDVQPTNVLLDPDAPNSRVKLIDLDYVGREIRRPTPVSASDLAWTRQVGRGVLKPPEYALGTVPFLDTCSDVFSYGLIVFWLLRRTPAFTEDDEYEQKVLTLSQGEIRDDTMRFPSGVWEMREDPLGQVLIQMTAFDRNERFASVAEALVALKTVIPPNLFEVS